MIAPDLDASGDDALPQVVTDLVGRVRAGERRGLAKAITLVESTRADHRRQAEAVIDELMSDTGRATRIGISGPPGAGKSTFIEAFGMHLVGLGLRVAVLAVDPSSRRTGGSILGDKTRMIELSRQDAAFIRPSPGGEQLGGVARRTREAMLLCEAAGFDVVVVETIGVGQSEVAVADMVDLFVLLTSPGGGDDLQGIKRGIMELADLIVVNKADGDLKPAAGRSSADYKNAVHLLRPRWEAWFTEVLLCSALEGAGIPDVWDAVQRFEQAVTASGELAETRSRQSVAWMWSEVRDALVERFVGDAAVRALLPEAEAEVAGGARSPGSATRRLLDVFSADRPDDVAAT